MAARSGGWLAGRVAVVTGGASGLGKALVHRFVEEGARVGVLDKSTARLEALRAEFGSVVVTLTGDVTVLADQSRCVEATVAAFGRLDTFVANAGIWDFGTSLLGLPDDTIDAAFDEMFGVNVKGVLLGAKAAARELARTEGSVIVTLSNASLYVAGGGPLYTASKHAALGLVRQLAYELAPRIRVNGVAVGGIKTDLRGPHALGLQDRSIAELPFEAMVRDALPLAKLARPEDYTGFYVALAAAESGGHATGSVLSCDGGLGVRGFPRPAAGYDLEAVPLLPTPETRS